MNTVLLKRTTKKSQIEPVQHRSPFHRGLSLEAAAPSKLGEIDNRQQATAQRALQAMADRSPGVQKLAQLQAVVDRSPRQAALRQQIEGMDVEPNLLQTKSDEEELQMQTAAGARQRQVLDGEELLQGELEPVQRQEELEEEELLQGKLDSGQRQVVKEEVPIQGRFRGSGAPVQRQGAEDVVENRTGMPDPLKAGLEQLSGLDLSRVRVHHNSSRPAQLNALAYAQGEKIHLGPGQERHLPHEGWHVVQQMQGRVRPTLQAQGVPINDDEGLELEADVMGARALQMRLPDQLAKVSSAQETISEQSRLPNAWGAQTEPLIQRKLLATDQLNVVGEDHGNSDKLRQGESFVAWSVTDGNYWGEHDFKVNGRPGDAVVLLFKSQMLELLHQPQKRGAIETLFNYCKSLEDAKGIKDPLETEKQSLFETVVSYENLIPEQIAYISSVNELDNSVWFTLDQARLIYDDLPPDSKQAYAEPAKLVRSLLEKIAMLANLSADKVVTEAKNILDLFVSLTELLENDVGHMTAEQLVFERSAHMAEAAVEGSDTLGIWKIGNAHVADDFSVLNPEGVATQTSVEFYQTYGDDVRNYNLPCLEEGGGWGRGDDKAYWDLYSKDQWKTWFEDEWAGNQNENRQGDGGEQDVELTE